MCSKLLKAHVPHPNNLVYSPTRYCKNIVRGRWPVCACLQTFLYNFDSATDRSDGAWLARSNSAHTAFYNRIVLFDVSNEKLIYCVKESQTAFNVSHPNNLVYFHLLISPTFLTWWCTCSQTPVLEKCNHRILWELSLSFHMTHLFILRFWLVIQGVHCKNGPCSEFCHCTKVLNKVILTTSVVN